MPDVLPHHPDAPSSPSLPYPSVADEMASEHADTPGVAGAAEVLEMKPALRFARVYAALRRGTAVLVCASRIRGVRKVPAGRRVLAVTAVSVGALSISACSTSNKPFQPDLFSTGISPYAHAFNATSAQACEAARRAVLSQGYTTTNAGTETIDATKGFQPTSENHVSVSFHIVCTAGESSSGTSVLYVNAVQDNYALKKSDTSASVGLSILGSVSLPIRSNNDSMVKISSETIPPGLFYDRFFNLVDRYLKTVVRATPISDADVISERLAPLPSPRLGNALPAPVIVAPAPLAQDAVKELPIPPQAAAAPASATSTASAAVAAAPAAASESAPTHPTVPNAATAATATTTGPSTAAPVQAAHAAAPVSASSPVATPAKAPATAAAAAAVVPAASSAFATAASAAGATTQ